MQKSNRGLAFASMRRIAALLVCLSVSGSMDLLAATALPASGEPPQLLTPARLDQPQWLVPASVTVIDREMIEASGAREIFQLLQLVPGMSAVKVDGNVPSVNYHGNQIRDSRRMLVIIDGRSQYLPGLARVLWNDFPLAIEDIERIEVTRGPAAAAYGANAFQSVINIISRHPQDVSGTAVAARGGNNGVQDWRVSSASRSGSVYSRVTVSSQDDDGYTQPLAGGEDRRDGKSTQSVNLRVQADVTERDSVELLAGASQRRLQLAASNSDFEDFIDFTELPESQSEEAFAQLRWQRQLSDSHQLKLQFYAQHKRSNDTVGGCFKLPLDDVPAPILPLVEPALSRPEAGAILFSDEMRTLFEQNNRDIDATNAALITALLTDPTAPVVVRLNDLGSSNAGNLCGRIDFDIVEKREDLELQSTLQINNRMRLISGANLRFDHGESDTFINGYEHNLSRAVFANLEWQLLDPLYFNLGGYWQDDRINGTFFSPRAGLIWHFRPRQSVRLVYATAVRTMDLFEKFADIRVRPEQLSGAFGADPQGTLGSARPEFFATQRADGTLEEEQIESWELGYFASTGPFQWDIRLFNEKLDNLVSGPLNIEKFRPDNDGRIRVRGAEAELSWRPHPRHLLRLNGARTDTDARHPNPSTVRQEEAFAARTLLGALWRYDISQRWMLSAFWHLADEWRTLRYERADMQVIYRHALPQGRLRVAAVVQQPLNNTPVVRAENQYEESRLFWLTATLDF